MDGRADSSRRLVDFVRRPAPAWNEPEYGGLFWLDRTGEWNLPEDTYYMNGAGGQRLGHRVGAGPGMRALNESFNLLVKAIPES